MNIFQNMSPDDWENFSSYYLENIGYEILESASVGPDGGKDLIAKKDSIRCLVSCKNFVRSNKSVTLSDEDSIADRMSQHKTEVFIGFYSTKAGNNLMKYLKSQNIHHLILDGSIILKNLTTLPFMVNQSFFYSGSIIQPKIFSSSYDPLLCCCGCGNDILNPDEIDGAKCYLSSSQGGLNLGWYLHDHIDRTEILKEFPINKFLHLTELNKIINEIEALIDTSGYNSTSQFDESFTKIVELSHQMIYPSDWGIG